MIKTILAATLALHFNLASALGAQMPTRFGTLSTNDESILLLNGKPVRPEVAGNTSLTLVAVVQNDEADIAIIENNGGTACPLLIRIITLSKGIPQVSPEFGSCSDLVSYTLKGGELQISMPKMQGKGNEVFKVQSGVVTVGGRPVK
jgi:hypothetical protein